MEDKIILVKLSEEEIRNLIYSNRVSIMKEVIDKIEEQYLEQSK